MKLQSFLVAIMTVKNPSYLILYLIIEFLGCYHDSKEPKLFNFSPGDYLPSDLTPFSCIEACGKHAHFAGVEDGTICLCSKKKPKKFDDNNDCLVPCKAYLNSNLSSSYSCGGRNRLSVYDVRKYIYGLQLHVPDVAKLYSPVELVTSIVNGIDISYKFFSTNDKTLYAEDLKTSKFTHYFTNTVNFEIVVEARNSLSFATAKAFVSVTDEYSEGNMSCHHNQKFGLDVECSGYVFRGSPFISYFDFGDGHVEHIESSVTFSYIGDIVSTNLQSSSLKNAEVLTKSFTVVFPRTEFFEESRISAFEFEAFEIGIIYLQIFRPKCLPNEVYCSNENQCQPATMPCQKYNEKSCKLDEVFCLLKGRCMPNVNYRCDEEEQPIVKAPINFVLIEQLRYNITETGRTMVALENIILANEGDVFGYTSYGGKILYENYTNTKAHYEFVFPSSVSLNSVFVSTESTIVHYQHLYKVHYIKPFKFYLQHKYSLPKTYLVTSNISAPLMVSVQIPVDKLNIQCPRNVLTNQEFLLTLNVDKGTNLTYNIDFGNGTQYIGISSQFNCSFTKSGFYRINASVFNLVSLESDSVLVKIFDDISGLSFESFIKPVALGEETLVSWCLKIGTNVTFIIDFGDDSSNEVFDFSSKRCHSVKHIFKNNGSFTVMISAKNDMINTSVIQGTALVEVPLKNLTVAVHHNFVTNNVYLDLGEPLHIEAQLAEGSNVVCRYDFNGSVNPIELSNTVAKYLFAKEGKYSVSVECFNSISKIQTNLTMIIIVEKLAVLSDLQVNVNNTILGEFSYVSATMATGSLYICKWDLGNSLEKKVDKSTFRDIIALKYNHVGNYTIRLTCWNSKGSVVATKIFSVDVPISNLKLFCPPKYINVSEKALFQIQVVNGSRLTHEVIFGDGNKQIISVLQTDSTKSDVYHLFKKPGMYEVTLKTWNSLDVIGTSCPYFVHVQCPISSVNISSNSPIRLDPGNAIFKAEGPSDCFPTNASVKWNFGDGSLIQTKPLISYGVVNTYTYLSSGKYAVVVIIQNQVSKMVLELVVDVQEIKSVFLSIYWIDTNRLVRGNENKYYPLDKKLYFNITSQDKDIAYTFNLDNSLQPKLLFVNYIEHVYFEPGTYLISCIVHNTLGIFKDEKEIVVQESILGMKVNITSSVNFGDPIVIKTHAIQYGSQVCGIIDFGNGVSYKINKNYCNENLENNSKEILYYFTDGVPLNLSYIYHTKGVHKVLVNFYNKVSSYLYNAQVNVIYRPCDDPQVLILSGGSLKQPVPSPRTSRLTIQSNVSLICSVAENVIFSWFLFDRFNKVLVSENFTAKMPFHRIPGKHDPSIFKIEENSVPYGLIRIELLVVYKSAEENLSYINSKDFKYFEIQYSRLLTKIEGGIRRAVGFMTDLEFDASESFDPDFLLLENQDDMNFTWYCRRKEEEFPFDYEYSSATLNKTSGCYKNGLYRLDKSIGGFKVLNEDASKISIFTDLVQNASYVMRVVVTKDTRKNFYDQEFIIYLNQPPSLFIYCSYNCYEKTIPSEPLRVQSVCANCRNALHVLYTWRLYEIIDKVNKRGRLVSEEIEITDLALKTTTPINNPNIALKPNVMKLGNKYVLRVAACRADADDELSGFSDFVFTVNQPPYGGFCQINPNTGVTLYTMFEIKCDQWNDEDTPLLYVVDSHCGDLVQNMYTGPENHISIILPLGNKEEDYWYDLIVRVEDKYKFGVSQTFRVQVKEPASVDYNAVGKSIESLAQNNELQALTRMGAAVASILNKKASNAESSKNREIILESLSMVRPCKLSEIKQIGGVHMQLTQSKYELTDVAQKKSAEVLSAMSGCMTLSDPRDPYMPDTAKTLFRASYNILSAGMLKNTSDKNSSASAGNIANTVDMIGSAFMRQMVAGDMPEIVSIGNISIKMAQIPEYADEDHIGFKLPNLTSVLKNHSESLFKSGRVVSVGAMVTSFSDNPYKDSVGSNDIASEVMGLAVSGPNGKPLDLASEELSLFVKRNLASDEPAVFYEYDKDGSLNIHRFNYTTESNFVVVESRPVDLHTQVNYFIAFNKTPTFHNHLANHSTINLEKAKLLNSLPDPFIRVFSSIELNGTGEYYIGVKITPSRKDIYGNYEYNPLMSYTLRIWETVCKIWDEELGTFVTKGCKVGQKTTFNKTHCVCKMEFNNESENKVSSNSLTPATIESKVVNTRNKREATVKKEKVKREVKRATFAASFFVAPNPIDFSKVFSGFLNLSNNPTAFSVVLSIFGIYLILLFWARREDRKDVERAGVTALKENDPSDIQFYEITVYTGFSGKGSTSANVFIQLSGDEGDGEVRQLVAPNKKLFKKRGQDVFLASFPDHIGDLQYLRIWHDNAGKSPSWYLSQVMVHDLNTDRKYLFINDNLIAVEAGNGSLERILPVAGPEDMTTFNHLFFSTSQKNISDNHIWFSVFIRPPKSRFTRVQRLSCCLTLLYCTMLTNAMFYQVGGESSESIQVGPLSFNPRQIGIAVITSLIIFPVNILIVGVFRNVGPKPTPEEMALKKLKRHWWLYELFFCCKQSKPNNFINLISALSGSPTGSRVHIMNETTISDTDIGLKLETLTQEKSRLEKEKKLKKQNKLPWWMKYFSWLLLVLVSFTSAFFVVLYGFTFGKEKSAQWLSTLFLTLFQDICVSQPIKIFGLALFIALIVKKPVDDEEEEYEGNKKQIDEEYINNRRERDPDNNESRQRQNIIRFQPPSKEKIAQLRAYRLKEIKMYDMMRDFVIYVMFVIALCQVTYSFMDSRSYMVQKSLDNIFIQESDLGPGFRDIKSLNDVWPWLNSTVVNALFSPHLYNGYPNAPGFTKDLSSHLFGGARLRQLRVEKDSCLVHPDFKRIISQCKSWYTIFNEDNGNYAPGWNLLLNKTIKSKYSNPWQYQTSSVLQTYPFIGYLATYTGGGYVADLGNYPLKSHQVINDLHQNKWIDGRTRALFLEFSTYNPQVNLFGIVNLLLEFSPSSAVEFFSSIHIARLYTFAGETATLTLVCQIFVVFFFLIAMYKEAKKIYKMKKLYFRGFWNLYEFFLIILLLITTGVFFSRVMLVKKAVKSIQEDQKKFVSFNRIVQWDQLFSGLTSVLVLLTCIKSIRILQYNKTISLFVLTLKKSASPLAAFFLIFAIFFTSFTAWAYLMFIPYLPEYSNYISASESVMSLLLGSFKFKDIVSAKPVLGSLWFTLIMIFGVMYIMNVFLTIVMETYASVNKDLSMTNQKYEIVDFMIKKFLKLISRDPQSVAPEEIGVVNMAMENLTESEPFNNIQKHYNNKSNAHLINKYHSDHEIENKLLALEKSLDKYWKMTCAFDSMEETVRKRVLSVQDWDFDETQEDVMQKALLAELAKWS
ncbi:polycystin family receptor for egg jelly isoform X2 [Hydra vulgaris]|uniref:polycystin family receptor for egg jelly isoform X2 n=1 Tax=Hydra vulgaris TaxID=6087 RepID=UPI0032EA3DC5